jgi:hypothetical protein
VSIGSTVIGQITTDSTGAGTLVLSSNPQGSSQQPLPADFPTSVTAGTEVTVGTLGGTLAAQSTGGGSGCSHSQPTVLTAQLTDPSGGATGTATYQTSTMNGTTTQQLTISVTGAAATTTLDVSVAGVAVGQITTDANGAGTLILSTNPHGANQQLLPADFPTVTAGTTTVMVGTLGGTLALTSSPETRLSSQLTDTGGSATGSVSYETGTENGVTETEFTVRVRGATTDSTLDVSIGGTVVGQVTTDGNGDGSLVLSSNPHGSNQQLLPANFPTTVTAGTTVTVDTLSGDLATSAGGGGHRRRGWR